MKGPLRDFVSDENRRYKFALGRSVASGLTGFVAGVVAASIVWMVALSQLGGI